jgi:hypothetical protein
VVNVPGQNKKLGPGSGDENISTPTTTTFFIIL